MNVPDDWASYQRTCAACGCGYHASDGGCDCEEREREQAEQRVWSALARVAPWLTRAVDVGPGAILTLPSVLSAACGYQADAPDERQRANARTVAGIMGRVAVRAGGLELHVTDADGSVREERIWR